MTYNLGRREYLIITQRNQNQARTPYVLIFTTANKDMHHDLTDDTMA